MFFRKKQLVLFLDKSQVLKSVNVITCFFCTAKKQKFRSTQAHDWNPLSPHPSFPVLSFSKCLVYILFIYTISILFVFHRKNLVFLMNRFTASTTEYFLKRKDIVGIKCLISVNYSAQYR